MASDGDAHAHRFDAIVVGAGISGLCTAELLDRRVGRERVCVLEAGPRPGGWAQTETVDGYRCDVGPNGFLDREPKMLEWVDALGLSDALVPASDAAAKRYLLKDDRLHELKGPPGFLFSPVLSMPARMRLLCEPFIKPKTGNPPESVWSFAARRIGKEAADTLVSAMVLGVFGGDARELSLDHCFPRMAAMENEHGSLFKAMRAKAKEKKAGGESGGSPTGPGGTLTTLDGGIGRLLERAAETVGPSLRLNASAASLHADGDVFAVTLASGEVYRAPVVVLATPAFVSADLTEPLEADVGQALRRIPYANMAVACTGYDAAQAGRALDGFGFLAPPNQGKRVLGCIWTSTVFPQSAPQGKVFLRTMIGGYRDPGAVELDDAEIMELLRNEIHSLLNIDGDPEFVRIYRHRRAIPQYMLHHGDVLAAVEGAEGRHPGLIFTGSAYRGVGLNDCVVQAHAAVERATEHLPAPAGE